MSGRRTAARAAAVAGAVVAVVAAGVVNAMAPDAMPGADPASSTAEVAETVVPTGTRLVAIGRQAVAVPDHWGDHGAPCGQPVANTVVFPRAPAGSTLCAPGRAADITWVSFGHAPARDLGPRAATRRDRCGGPADLPTSNACVTTFTAPGQPDLTVASTVPGVANGRSRAEVDAVAATHRVLRDHVGIPSPGGLDGPFGGSAARGEPPYLGLLRSYGLDVRVVEVPASSRRTGDVIGVHPVPGTIVPVGSTTTVEVAG
ncbi:PASTA domain-containing protein [Nocardioides sp. CPCC 205120]|uniref:PASTA domain-containing protein n=1 Tax=Nocardioides sp. CPCC 205120 TaxID=3406462 RepID=UPI003B50B440